MDAESRLITLSCNFASKAHTGQIRNWTKEDYICHPLRVAGAVGNVVEHPRAIAMAIAFLHDVIEDCGVTRNELIEQFGYYVANGVYVLSERPPRKGTNRAERKAQQRWRFQRCKGQFGYVVHTVKLADLLDNIPGIRANAPKFWTTVREEALSLRDVLIEGDTTLRNQLAEELETS